MPKICLNMIVKNESKIIERLLTSVLPMIDSYCICDTGSTDNTIQLINDFFRNRDISGKIVVEPFKDFGYNRTFALQQCIGMPDADYLLLLDADMILEIPEDLSPTQFKENLKYEVYHLFQGSRSFFYKNVRLIKNIPGMSYWGVTHEYLKPHENAVYFTIPMNQLFINDVGDGGSKTEKFIRDIRLLKKGLEENPNNDRYTFYLGNSYKDAGQYEDAIETYKKRIKIGGWQEEVWHSYYSIGKCYKELGNMKKAIQYWLEGYAYYPHRIENLYEIINYYRIIGHHTLAYTYFCLANYERERKRDYDNLFLQKDIYDYKLDYELSIIGFYCNWENFDMKKVCMRLLENPRADEYITKNVMTNYKYYTPSIIQHKNPITAVEKIFKTVGKLCAIDKENFVSSTPSICWNGNTCQLILNTRFVNYKINERGEYINQEKIQTINVISLVRIMGAEWEITEEYILSYNKQYDDVYVGLEDVRLFSYNDGIYYTANRGLPNGNMVIEHGEIDIYAKKTVNPRLMKIENQQKIEKNWVLFTTKDDSLKMIYNWFPLTIGDVKPNKNGVSSELVITNTIETPAFFKYLRGSTHGIEIGDEIWFICHLVSYDERRYYYHCFVVLDSETFQIKKYSSLFTFEKKPVEYTLGMVYISEFKELVIGYSLLDKETKYMKISMKHVKELF
jgi:tetratricopeptide (TPR) repeat protein